MVAKDRQHRSVAACENTPAAGPLDSALRRGAVLAIIMVVVYISACDTIGPETEPRLVVSCYVNAGEPLPSVSVHRTGRLDGPYRPRGRHAVTDAEVTLRFLDRSVPYRPSSQTPGRYEPQMPAAVIPVGERFELQVAWQDARVHAASRVPPPIQIDSLTVDVAENAVEAVFADSIGLNVKQGFMYPVDVTMWWTDTTETEADSTHWIHAQVNPPAAFPSAVVGYFLRTSSVVPEERTDRRGNRRKWTGVYGVPVASDTSALEPHDISIFLLRTHTDYARYATSRNTPEQREPVSNLSQGRGIVAGISFDSVSVRVDRMGLNASVR